MVMSLITSKGIAPILTKAPLLEPPLLQVKEEFSLRLFLSLLKWSLAQRIQN